MVSLNLIEIILYSSVTSSVPSGPPQNFTISVTSRSIAFSWSPPLLSQRNGDITGYNLTCTVGGVTNSARFIVTSLTLPVEPFTNYSCTVSAATVVGDGLPTSAINGVTHEESECFSLVSCFSLCFSVSTEPESPPNNFSGVSKNFSSIFLNWDIPQKPNGVITHYQLYSSGGGQVFNRSVIETTTTLSGLLPYTNYSCSITAHTSVGGGPAATINLTTLQDGLCIDKI